MQDNNKNFTQAFWVWESQNWAFEYISKIGNAFVGQGFHGLFGYLIDNDYWEYRVIQNIYFFLRLIKATFKEYQLKIKFHKVEMSFYNVCL